MGWHKNSLTSIGVIFQQTEGKRSFFFLLWGFGVYEEAKCCFLQHCLAYLRLTQQLLGFSHFRKLRILRKKKQIKYYDVVAEILASSSYGL